ncbi:MAG: membrane protein required for colicin V production [Halieaceae bacterium]|jgi:membrane protein required for colicin V production
MPELNGADIAIIVVIGLSSVISLLRGFVKEAMSLLAWIAAFIVATMFRDPMAAMLGSSIESASVRYLTAYGILFVATLVLGAMLNMLMGQLIKVTGLSWLDRILGTGFGIARGVLIVMLIMYVLQYLVPVEEEVLWRDSSLVPHLLVAQDWVEVVFSDVLAEVRER